MNILKKFISKLFSKKRTCMESEILEQPEIIFELIKKYVNNDYTINLSLPDSIDKIALIASGSSYHSATIAANFIRDNVHCPAQSYYASEISIINNFDVDNTTLYVFISQSGETSDTNKALEIIAKKTDKTLAVTNTKNSTLYNNSRYKMLTFAGKEKSIASTKAMCAQTFCLFIIAAKLLQLRFIPSREFVDNLLCVPDYISNAFNKRDEIKNYAQCLINYENAAVLASGMFYPLAKEAALKIKETSYINTTAYPTGEFLHGHIAILNKKCAIVILVNQDNYIFAKKVISNINFNYKTDFLVITSSSDLIIDEKHSVSIFSENNIEFLFTNLVLIQLLAFESAKMLSRDVDKPQGLSKIVK